MAARTRAENRHNRRRVIEYKKKVIKEQHNYWSFKHEGQLSKGKIHCSCPMCSAKFNTHPSIRDSKKIDVMKKEQMLYKHYGLAV